MMCYNRASPFIDVNVAPFDEKGPYGVDEVSIRFWVNIRKSPKLRQLSSAALLVGRGSRCKNGIIVFPTGFIVFLLNRYL